MTLILLLNRTCFYFLTPGFLACVYLHVPMVLSHNAQNAVKSGFKVSTIVALFAFTYVGQI